jgi:hypothetical protein
LAKYEKYAANKAKPWMSTETNEVGGGWMHELKATLTFPISQFFRNQWVKRRQRVIRASAHFKNKMRCYEKGRFKIGIRLCKLLVAAHEPNYILQELKWGRYWRVSFSFQNDTFVIKIWWVRITNFSVKLHWNSCTEEL